MELYVGKPNLEKFIKTTYGYDEMLCGVRSSLYSFSGNLITVSTKTMKGFPLSQHFIYKQLFFHVCNAGDMCIIFGNLDDVGYLTPMDHYLIENSYNHYKDVFPFDIDLFEMNEHICLAFGVESGPYVSKSWMDKFLLQFNDISQKIYAGKSRRF